MSIDFENLALLLAELRLWIALLGLTKTQSFSILIAISVFVRLPLIFQQWRELKALNLDFRLKSAKIIEKIEDERAKRKRKSVRSKRDGGKRG